jgi:hypothetical protein
MEQEKIKSTVLQNLDSRILHSYNKDKNQVMLMIDKDMFNQILEELHN